MKIEKLSRPTLLRRLGVACCVVMAVASAQAQEATAPSQARDATSPGSSGSVRTKDTQVQPRPADSAQPRREASRWERFRNSIRPFRARSDRESSSTGEKRRSLLGEKIVYGPGQEPELPDFSPMTRDSDSSVARTRRNIAQEPPPPIVPSGVAGPRGLPNAVGNGDNPSNAVPPIEALPMPTPEQPGENGPDEPALEAAVAGPEESQSESESEREYYSLPKRFLRGYPTLVLWFPELLGPLRESDRTARDDEHRAGERSGGGGYETDEAPGAHRRALGIPPRFRLRSTRATR